MNFFGVLLELDPVQAGAAACPTWLGLHLEDEVGEFQIECLIFEQDDTQLRALFKHGSFEVAERLLAFVKQQKNFATCRSFWCGNLKISVLKNSVLKRCFFHCMNHPDQIT